MIFGEVALDEAEGALLAHARTVAGVRWTKGRALTAADLAAARAEGLDRLTVARLEPGDVAETDAAVRLGAALAGAHVAAEPPVHGRVNLTAQADGLLAYAAADLDSVNAVDEGLTAGALPPFARVRAGDTVATVKVIPYAVAGASLDRALAAAVRLRVARFSAAPVALVQTQLPGQSRKLLAKTVAVTRDRLAALGSALADDGECPHEVAPLAARLGAATAPLVLVAAASATADRRDVIPAAIEAAGGAVIRLGMPVDPGNMLCLGRIGDRHVIGLPGCARSPKRNGLDLVLERLLTGLGVDAIDIARMGVGGLLPEGERPDPRRGPSRPRKPVKTGAVILAAGRSSRMGGPNKLLADLGGRPVLAHVLAAVDAAGLPSLVVTGSRADEVAALAAPRPTVHATDFAEGLSRSLRAGLAAVPADWAAAIVCLGDMPAVTPALLGALAAHAGPFAVVVPVHDGKRGNPVLWGRDHFPRLMEVAGDIGGKALLAELADRVTEVEAPADAIFTDIDTPEALDAARARL